MEWISVQDRLPPEGEVCLLLETYPPHITFKMLAYTLKLNKLNCYHVGGRVQGCWVDYFNQFDYALGLSYVTHWMPLPTPPED